MIRNYLLIAIRSLKRHPGFTLINLIGLSVSMSVGLLLILFVRDQASKDSFHAEANQIYRVYSDFKSASNSDNALYATSPAELSRLLADEVPGVEASAKIRGRFGGTVSYGGVGLPISGFYADPTFMEMFSFELSDGDPATALQSPYSVLITPATSERFFGDADPIGEVLSVEGQGDFTVTGLLDRSDYSSHFPLSIIASYSTLESDSATVAVLDDWTGSIYRSYTYFKLEDGTSPETVQARIDQLIPTYFGERNGNKLHGLVMQPLTKINLGVLLGNEIGVTLPGAVAYFLFALAVVILLTACFNYVGLTVSRSLKRAREVGVRKMFGAGRTNVLAQFLVETVVVSALSVIVAVFLLNWIVPAFNSMTFVQQTNSELNIHFASDPGLYLVLGLFTLAIAFFAGIYPASFLSRFEPAQAVKGLSGITAGGSKLRKSLVVVQLTLSVVFIVITTTMFRQSDYMLNADYGFEQENIVNVNLFSVPYDNFLVELSSSPNVELVSGMSPLPAMGNRRDRWLSTPEMSDRVKGYLYDIDENLVENLGLTLLAGRNLSPDISGDADRNVLVNERFLGALALGSPDEAIGKTFIDGGMQEREIVGVLKDYQSDLISTGSNPNLLQYAPDRIQWANVRIIPGQYDAAVEDIREAWGKMGHVRSIEFELFDVQLRTNFINVLTRELMQLVGFIAILALVIACLGLLGIASYNVERRTKEVSIRKVLGASAGSVVSLLTRDFVILMGIALVIAVPVSWMLTSAFLSTFVQRVDLTVGTFVFAVGSILVMALTVISSQTVQAAFDNPVDNLHDE